MKFLKKISALFLLAMTLDTHASIVLDNTRYIYPSEKTNIIFSAKNEDSKPLLTQIKVIDTQGSKNTPFLITPPIIRIEPKSTQNYRIALLSEERSLPMDRESLFWLDILAVPPIEKNESANVLRFGIKTRVKLIYRPAALKKSGLMDAAKSIAWELQGDSLIARNTSPYFITFYDVSLNSSTTKGSIDFNMVEPFGSVSKKLPNNQACHDLHKCSIHFSIIDDYGVQRNIL